MSKIQESESKEKMPSSTVVRVGVDGMGNLIKKMTWFHGVVAHGFFKDSMMTSFRFARQAVVAPHGESHEASSLALAFLNQKLEEFKVTVEKKKTKNDNNKMHVCHCCMHA